MKPLPPALLVSLVAVGLQPSCRLIHAATPAAVTDNADAAGDGDGNVADNRTAASSFPRRVGPFLLWADDVIAKYEANEFHYSKHLVGGPELHGCCATHVHVLWERRQDEIHAVDAKYPLAVAVPNFTCDPQHIVDVAVQQVRANPESFEHIQNRMENKDKGRRGGGYPGPQIGAGTEVSYNMLRCIKPVMAEYFPYIDQLDYRSRVFLFSLAALDSEGLLRGQKLPHTDIDWHFGVDADPLGRSEPDGSARYFVPQGIAAVFGLTDDFQDTGTGLFRSKFPSPGPEGGTPFDFLPTKWRNEQFYSTMAVQEEAYGQTIDDNVTRYYGSSKPSSADNNPFVEKTVTAPVRYNQVVFYDMRRLHSLVVDEEAEARLSPDPTKGRLTLNLFWWQTQFEKSERPCSAYTTCEGCSGTPFCTWCAKVGECVVNTDAACKGPQHRAGYQGLARCDLHEFVAAKRHRGAGSSLPVAPAAGAAGAAPVPAAPGASEFCTGFGSCSATSSESTGDEPAAAGAAAAGGETAVEKAPVAGAAAVEGGGGSVGPAGDRRGAAAEGLLGFGGFG